MLELNGKYGTAKVFTMNVEQEAISQIINLMNQPFVDGSKVRMMPDVHAGAGCVIGTTMTVVDKVVPNLVGVDIACGMYTCKLVDEEVDLVKLDRIINEHIPSGFSVRAKAHRFLSEVPLKDLKCPISNENRVELSLGTLGGGNHFIELGKDESGAFYLVIHSGSRNLGKTVAEFYQEAAFRALKDKSERNRKIIDDLKKQGRESEIQSVLQSLGLEKVHKELAYCEGQLMADYLHDVNIAQKYAQYNRQAMAEVIVSHMGFEVEESFTTSHNYIDLEHNILRKGAVSAQAGEKLIIPINMRDGSIIAVGKGNPDWNCSAPHGAGRLMSRSKAKQEVTLEEFQASMEGIYSTSIGASTIDESPMAYKPIDEILENIQDTVDVLAVVKPVYNFKAS